MRKEELFILIVFVILLFVPFSQAAGNLTLTLRGTITIHSPLNASYHFEKDTPLNLSLNVSADFEAGSWWYDLYKLSPSTLRVNQSISFSPNSSFIAVKKSNNITIFANSSSGLNESASVVFYVDINNTSPVLGEIPSLLYACETSSSNPSIQTFNATDIDEDLLTVEISPSLNTTNFFGVEIIGSRYPSVNAIVYSGAISKSATNRSYSRTISVNDGQALDSQATSIFVIAINNAPSITSPGAQTLIFNITNVSYQKQLVASDIEDGDSFSENLTFSLLSFPSSNLSINSTGFISGVFNETQNGTYEVQLCVADNSLSYIHPNISLCSNDGLSKTTCLNFSMTITNNSNAPNITYYYPSSLAFSSIGTTSLVFNASVSDQEGGIPDNYWYINNALAESDLHSSSPSFNHTFGCGVSGLKTVKLVSTDGLYNTSVQWNITVQNVDCSSSASSSSGGGGGGGPGCKPLWACDPWNSCQLASQSYDLGILSGPDYLSISKECEKNSWVEGICGYQTRNCQDLSYCRSIPDESLLQVCYFSSNPSCNDGIKNCHDSDCEFLVDCGGPCDPCPTCSDGKQNQGENGIDCGGPCPNACPPEKPLISDKNLRYLMLAILAVIIAIIAVKSRRLIKLTKPPHNE